MRTIYLILVCLIYADIQAQTKKAVTHIDWKGPDIELNTITNKQYGCTFLTSKDSVKVFLMKRNGTLRELFTIERFRQINFLGGFIKNDTLFFYMGNGKDTSIYSWVYSLRAKSLSAYTVPFVLKGERIIQRLSSTNHFLYFVFNKKASEFAIYKFNDHIQYDSLRFRTDPDMWDIITDKVLLSNTTFNIQKIDIEGDCDIEIAKSQNKLYILNDTLHLLLNRKNAVTDVYSFDLRNNKIDQRLIFHGSDTNNLSGCVYNSFLLCDKLYYASASLNSLLLQVVDFKSGTILKDFKVGRDEEVYFKNTSIEQISESGNNSDYRELSKTKQLLRKIVSSKMVITATPNGSNVNILIASYKEIHNNGNPGYWSNNGTSANGLPVATYIPAGGFYRDKGVKSARFKTMLNSKTDEHVEGDIPSSINEKIQRFTEFIEIPSKGENLVRMGGIYSYIFYDKKQRNLALVQF